MIEVEDVARLQEKVGGTLGISDWVLIDQSVIDRFAEATGDRNWYHVDVERARAEMPDGKTIAHGLLLSSLVPGLAGPMLMIRRRGRALNYGSDRVRYIAPVQCGARVRLHVVLQKVEPRSEDVVMTRRCTMQIEGGSKPAMVADVLTLIYGERGRPTL
jgi:acyl dehydratase